MSTRLIALSVSLLFLSLSGCETIKEPTQPASQEGRYQVSQLPVAETGAITRSLPNNLRKSVSPTQTTSVNSLGDHWRYTAEDKDWRVMVSRIAYFRDEYAGVETIIQGATDGETWYADAIRPDGSRITWGTMRFYSSYAGQQNCFVSPWWYECGTRDIIILWYTGVRCSPTGTWTMNFYNNGVKFATTTFTLKPQIEAGKVASGSTYNQGSYPQKYDEICKGPLDARQKHTSVPCSGEYSTQWTIAEKGCFLTASAMISKYHGADVNPLELNNWLNTYRDKRGKPLGFSQDGKVGWDGVAQFARTKGINISVGDANYTNDQLLNLICNFGPVIIRIKLDPKTRQPAHWVVATGWDPANNTWLINDPAGGETRTLASDQFNKIRLFLGPDKFVPKSDAGILIRLHSPAELLLSDPQGRRLGRDPIKNISYNEIPRGDYAIVGLMDDTDPEASRDETAELSIRGPIDGNYLLRVIGTDVGRYLLSIYGADEELNSSVEIFEDVPIAAGIVNSYSFSYAKAVGSEISVSGGFDGGGQRPKDVNKFLSYANPSESQTTLPTGTTTFPLHIFYGSTIIPGTFKAELNGVDISSSFNPLPDRIEIVTLNLAPGRNVLVVSVNGTLPTRVATDTDRLVFKVQ